MCFLKIIHESEIKYHKKYLSYFLLTSSKLKIKSLSIFQLVINQ